MAHNDLTVEVAGGILNIRVGAIIMKENKFLMVGNDREDYLYSVGGRIKFGETAQEAVVREVMEETGVGMDIDRLGFVHENFFKGDVASNMDKTVYEISLYFYMKVPDDFEPVCSSFTDDESLEHLAWIKADSKKKFFPEFFATELMNPCTDVKHIVTREC